MIKKIFIFIFLVINLYGESKNLFVVTDLAQPIPYNKDLGDILLKNIIESGDYFSGFYILDKEDKRKKKYFGEQANWAEMSTFRKKMNEYFSLGSKFGGKSNKSPNLEILESMGLISQEIQTQIGNTKTKTNVLVFVTYGINKSKNIDFSLNNNITDGKYIKEVVTKLKAVERMPNLKGIDVYIYLTGTSDDINRRNFWEKFIKLCGAKSVSVLNQPSKADFNNLEN